jgi:hypothetical protein
MKPIVANLLATGLAVAAPASLVIGWYAVGTFRLGDSLTDPYAWLRVRNFALISSLISLAHVLLLRLPAFLLLRQFHAVTWYSSVGCSFALGCLPVGIFAWPLGYPTGASAPVTGQMARWVVTLANGVSNLAGWLDYWAWGTSFMGLLGAAGGISFWLAWRLAKRPNHSSKRMRVRTARRLTPVRYLCHRTHLELCCAR